MVAILYEIELLDIIDAVTEKLIQRKLFLSDDHIFLLLFLFKYFTSSPFYPTLLVNREFNAIIKTLVKSSSPVRDLSRFAPSAPNLVLTALKRYKWLKNNRPFRFELLFLFVKRFR